jgi:peptidoglycan hydrolase-like protein with peptidoglycan-binding domain
MSKRFVVVSVSALAIVSIALFGCKAKVETPSEETKVEATATDAAPQSDVMLSAQQAVVEPASSVATETIPPTATVQEAKTKASSMVVPATDRNKDVQTALKNAGFYTGSIDGKIGPKTKSAIQEFQKAKGLKVDGKIGPKTWAEMEKYLLKQ